MSIGNDLKITISAADNASKGLRVVQGAVAAMAAETRKAATDMNKLGLSYKAPTKEAKKLGTAMTRLRARMVKIRPAVAKMFRGLKTRISAVTSSVFRMRTAFIALAGTAALGLVVKNLIATASAFEDLRTQLDALQGSSKAGQEALEWIKDFAKETPLSMEGVTRAFVMARAFGLDPMDGTMQSLVDINAKLGGSMEKLIFITRGVGQMFTKGRISAQEMNLQLTEQGVPAWELLARAMNRANDTTKFTTASLQKMSEKGELGKDAIKLLIDEMGRFAKGAALEKMDDFSGLLSNFGDQAKLASLEFATAKDGIFDFSKALLETGITSLTQFREDGSLKAWGEGIGTAMTGVIETIADVINSVKKLETAALKMRLTLLEISKAGLELEFALTPSAFGIDEEVGRELKAIGADVEFFKSKIAALNAEMAKTTSGAKEFAESVSNNLKRISAERQSGAKFPSTPVPFGPQPLQGPSQFPTKDQFLAERDRGLERMAFEEEILQNQLEVQRRLGAESATLALERLAFGKEMRDAANAEELAQQQEHQIQKGALLLELSETEKRIARETQEAVARSESLKRRHQQLGLSTAMTLANTAAAFSKKNSKAVFLITRGLMAAQAFVAAHSAAAQALAVPVAPNYALSSATLTAGMANVAAIVATSFAPGSPLRGGGGATAPSGAIAGPNASNFQNQDRFSRDNQQQPGIKVEIHVNTLDPASLENFDWEPVMAPLADALGNHVSRGGSTGEVDLVINARGD